MKRLMYFGGLLSVLLVSFIVLNACKGFGNIDCTYTDDQSGAFVPTPETNPCPTVNLATPVIQLESSSGDVFDFNMDTFADIISSEIKGKVKGWQLCVGYKGDILLYDAGGLRTGSKDCPVNSPMTACTKTRIGSQTKNYVATAIITLLLEAGKDPFTEPIMPYLPPSWGDASDFPVEVQTLTFAHFLGHRNGFSPPNTSDAAGTSREDIEAWMKLSPKTGTVGAWDYQNGNYNLMRVVFPRVYGAAKGITYTDAQIDTDEECSAIEVAYIEDFICKPLGNNFDILNWDDDGSEVLYFDDFNDNDGQSHDYENIGAGTMVVSAENMVKYYMELFEGGSVIPSNVVTSIKDDAWKLGLNRFGNTAGPMNEEYFGHGGTLTTNGKYLSITFYFPGGLVASLAVNSCVKDHIIVGDRCDSPGPSGILVNAFNRSF